MTRDGICKGSPKTQSQGVYPIFVHRIAILVKTSLGRNSLRYSSSLPVASVQGFLPALWAHDLAFIAFTRISNAEGVPKIEQHQSASINGSSVTNQMPLAGARPASGPAAGIGALTGRPVSTLPMQPVTVKTAASQGTLNSLLHHNPSSGVNTGTAPMMPPAGVPQSPGQPQPLSSTTSTAVSSHHPPAAAAQPQSQKYAKLWEGILAGKRKGNIVLLPICKLEVCNRTDDYCMIQVHVMNDCMSFHSMRFRHLMIAYFVLMTGLSPDFVLGNACVGLAANHANHASFTTRIHEPKGGRKGRVTGLRTTNAARLPSTVGGEKAVIQLPSQTLLLASSDKPGRMIGVLFPGVFCLE
ncbi:hypothetical protein R1flu_007714 [Riccia fluitans]|uniref:Uncharacterized protein n=1 Tax=Riccia fluitans TaxID=41844 RepID=A0ABD1Z0I9_9MARC